jgi:hypothetical protein
MTIQDWGAIGEILGALAIFITLLYLATQIKYMRLTTMDTNRSNRVTGIRDLNGRHISEAELRNAWNKTIGPNFRKLHTDMAETFDISFDEASLIITQGASWGFTHWAQYRSMKSSEDESELKNIISAWYGENPMRALINHPNFRDLFEADYVIWIDEIISSEK